MSDVMLFGVLRMPYEMAMGDELSRYQFWQRVQEAADRLEAAERTTPPSTSTAETAACEAIAKWNSLPDAKLVYDARAQTAACGGTGPKSYALPPSTASEVGEREAIEAAAKAIYRLFEGAEAHPWVERGNSLMQGEARRYARAALASKPVAREVEAIARNMMTLGFESGHIVSHEAAEDMLHQFDAAIRASNPAPSGAAKGGNTKEEKHAILQELVDIAQECDMGYGSTIGAEVDVEAERKLFEASFLAEFGGLESIASARAVEIAWQSAAGRMWLAARRTQEGAKDAERFRQAIACEDSAEVLYGAVLSHAPNGKAIRNEFDAAIAATQTKESQQ